jgi:hypothetical protein
MTETQPTPLTTADVKRRYSWGMAPHKSIPGGMYTVAAAAADFDRWLTAHDAEVEARSMGRDLPCDGWCNVNDGPQEECSRHGRTPGDLWGIIADLNRQLADERAKRPDRDRYVSEAHRRYSGSGNHPGGERHAFLAGVDAVLSSLALKTETDQELQDRIEVLEKNLAYEVAQKIKLAEQLQAATATDLTLEQARWKMHAGIESRCSEEVAAEVKPVIDLVFSSLALEPEAREEPTGRNWVPKEELDFYVEPLTTEAREERRPSRVLNEYDDSTTRGLRRGEEVLRQLEHHWAADSATQAIEELLRLRRIVEAREVTVAKIEAAAKVSGKLDTRDITDAETQAKRVLAAARVLRQAGDNAYLPDVAAALEAAREVE